MPPSSRAILAAMDYKLGKHARAKLLHHCELLQIRHESLHQSSNPTRFYHAFEETFLFVLKGSVFLTNHHEDMVLKAYQGTLLPRDSIIIATVLEPDIELCLITFSQADISPPERYFTKLSTGNVEAQTDRYGMLMWPLWDGDSGMIAIHLYPSGYHDDLYYHRQTEQFILPLTGPLLFADKEHPPQTVSQRGAFFAKRRAKAIINNEAEGISALCVSTPSLEKGRVMVLPTRPFSV